MVVLMIVLVVLVILMLLLMIGSICYFNGRLVELHKEVVAMSKVVVELQSEIHEASASGAESTVLDPAPATSQKYAKRF